MKKVENPTFSDSNGKLHSTADAAARSDAKGVFYDAIRAYDADESTAEALAAEWKQLLSRLLYLKRELDEATTPANGDRVPAKDVQSVYELRTRFALFVNCKDVGQCRAAFPIWWDEYEGSGDKAAWFKQFCKDTLALLPPEWAQ